MSQFTSLRDALGISKLFNHYEKYIRWLCGEVGVNVEIL